jgi:hypothetical protein
MTPQLRSFASAALLLCALLGNPLDLARRASAQSSAAQPNSVDMEQVLFVQTLPLKNGKDGYALTWIPVPLQKYCLGKTSQQCATMDFCLRTTTPSIAMCRNLGSALQHMPRYPRDMSPRRMLSVFLIPPSTMNGFDLLQKLVETRSRSSLQLFSMAARVTARVRFTRQPDDDSFSVLEILAAPSF